MASNFHGDAYFELVDEGTVTAERYKLFLTNMLTYYGSLQRPIPPENLLLMHDNARPHVARLIVDWLLPQNVMCVKQPPYSPDFNIMDRFVFRNLEIFRRGQDYNNLEEVNKALSDYIQTLSERKLMNERENLKTHLQKVPNSKTQKVPTLTVKVIMFSC